MTDDALQDFERRELTFDGRTRPVYVSGRGPAVLVMAELPGISPDVARFARWVREAGFTVHLPSLFGRDGAYPEAEAGRAVLERACLSAEFRALAANQSSPVTRWLRELARAAHQACGGPGVGAVGMCFTGGFALSLMLEPAVLAPVLCQPSLPLGAPAGLAHDPGELAAVRERLEREALTVRAYRFEGDRFCTAARFAAYREALGPRFEPRVLPDSAANPRPPPFFERVVGCPHSVVTAHLIDEAGQPTRAARDEILAFLAARLRPARSPSPRLRLTGRGSSHFTRVARMMAEELGVELELEVARDLLGLQPEAFGGHPALKIPVLETASGPLYGTENICLELARLAGRAEDPRVVLPARHGSVALRSAQELVWQAMALQVQLVMGTLVAGLPAENPFFHKARAGLEGCLGWLEGRLGQLLAELPTPRDVSLLEVTLFCLLEHLAFRPTVPVEPYPALAAFAAAQAERPSARRTAYRFDP